MPETAHAPLVVAVIPADTVQGRAELRGVSDAAHRFGWLLETIDPALVGDNLRPSLPLLARADGAGLDPRAVSVSFSSKTTVAATDAVFNMCGRG